MTPEPEAHFWIDHLEDLVSASLSVVSVTALLPRNWFRKSILVILRSVNFKSKALPPTQLPHSQTKKKKDFVLYLCIFCLFSLLLLEIIAVGCVAASEKGH